MHYIITEGGKAPNIVPEEAEVYYFLRANKPDDLAEVVDRVRKIAQGAAMMTETDLEITFEDGCSAVINNHYLADLQYQAMELIGPIQFTEEELAFAQEINDAFPGDNAYYIERMIERIKPPNEYDVILKSYKDQPLLGHNFPGIDETSIMTGSTDVGDLSRIAPVSMLRTTCTPTGVPGHSWGNVAASGMSIGHKGMMHAAKIMAVTASEMYSDPEHLRKIRLEFDESTKGKPYTPPVPEDQTPIRYHPEG
jgi:aminobenzoyl-glutamate utilization protein B